MTICSISLSAQMAKPPQKKGFGKAKISLFFKRYFDFRNSFTASRYDHSEPITSRLTFPFNSQGYKLAFYDEFDTLNLNKWQVGMPWGTFHGQQPHQYYGDSQVFTHKGKLIFTNEFKPKTFKLNGRDTIIPYSVGCVNSYYGFSATYGYYAIRSKNPSGLAAWPAFWLTGKKYWPPEIDIFEMYSECKAHEIHNQKISLHFGSIEDHTKRSLTKTVRLPHNTDSIYHIYSCLWTPKKIIFFTDGIKVKTIKLNKWMRQYFSQEMIIVINNAIDPAYIKCVSKEQLPQNFQIDWVRVYTK